MAPPAHPDDWRSMRTVVSPGPAVMRRTPTFMYWENAPTKMLAVFEPTSAVAVQSSCQLSVKLRADEGPLGRDPGGHGITGDEEIDVLRCHGPAPFSTISGSRCSPDPVPLPR